MNSERPSAAQDQKEREQVGGEPVQPSPEEVETTDQEVAAGGDVSESLGTTVFDGMSAGVEDTEIEGVPE
jgi:hypothetical protein